MNKNLRAALALAVAGSLVLPGYAVADEKPAQPGTVRPAEKAEAQPGTAKNEAPKEEITKAESKPEVQAAPDPAPVIEAAPEPMQEAPAPAPAPAPQPEPAPVNYEPVVEQTGPSQAELATEQAAAAPVRESVVEPVIEETTPVRTERADEVAQYELAAAVEDGGDVRDQAGKDDEVVIREGEDGEIAPADSPDGEPGEDDDDVQSPAAPSAEAVAGSEQSPPANVDSQSVSAEDLQGTEQPVEQVDLAQPAAEPLESVTAGAGVDNSVGAASIEVQASPAETAVSATGQAAGGSESDVSVAINHADQVVSVGVEGQQTSASYDAASHVVNVDVAGQQFDVEIPDVPSQVTETVEQVQQAVPANVAEAVDSSVVQVEAATNDVLASMPNGEEVTDTAVGQVTTWFESN
ncbi:hypothetical protein ACXZ66_04020 [Corynebacterium sp. S7]